MSTISKSNFKDQILKLSDVKLAYIAGLIDGEGTVAIYRHKNPECRKGYGYSIYVSITNTNYSMIQWLNNKLCAGCIRTDRREYRSGYCYSYIIPQNPLRILLPRVFKYLVIKNNQVALLIEFLDIISIPFMVRTNDMNLRLEHIVDELKSLHHQYKMQRV